MANKIEKQFLDTENKGPVRLNKYLSEAGVCSRREADKLIAAGQVTVDGVRAETGMKVEPWQVVRIGKKQVSRQEEMIVLAVNKPRGIVCTEERRERDSIVRFLNYPGRITYVGRLDKDSEGLLLMTNNGDIINRMMRAANKHEKEYKVTVDKPVTDEFLKEMAGGVPILDTVTRPCQVEKLGKYKFKIILTQGLNRQIRRMCEAVGLEVIRLKRNAEGVVKLGMLQPGKYRELTKAEVNGLRAAAAKAGVSDITQKKDALRFTLAVFRPEALVQVCGLTKYKFRLTLSAGETPMLTLKLKPGADVLETALELVEDLKLATQALEKA